MRSKKHKSKKERALSLPGVRRETAPPSDEYHWLSQQNSPTDPEGIPQGLENMSETGAIAWVHANCKFASGV